jgi:hypothetical protein
MRFTKIINESIEYALWGLPEGKTDKFHEVLLLSRVNDRSKIDMVKKMASEDGYHSFRVQSLDIEKDWDWGTFKKAIK